MLISLALTPAALAGSCDALVSRAEKQEGEALIATYAELISCGSAEAEGAFHSFMTRSGDAETLAALSLTAIDAKIWKPVWEMMGKVPDYEARDVVAETVGAACTDHEQVVPFLQGAYYGLRDIDFSQWDDAFVSCDDGTLGEWVVGVVSEPPASLFDEKWNGLVSSYVTKNKAGSLAVLGAAGVKAASNGGPFEAILASMEESVLGEFGASPSDEDQAKLEQALLDMAKQLPPEQARSVADRLANSGSEAKAAELLPAIFPDRVQAGGGFFYGAAAVEACADGSEAILHTALVSEDGSRYFVQPDLEEPMRAAKARAKCDTDSPWAVIVTPEPLESDKALDGWVDGLVAQYEGKGFAVKTKAEKDVAL